MNKPNPAIVAQAAVRRLPRVALLLFCLAYILPGFIGRDAWKSADVSTLGFMAELVQGTAHWLQPTLLGQPPEDTALLPYWLGAWAMQAAPSWVPADAVARLPFVLLLALALACTWYSTYCLARTPRAQPVAFAFGGEALPRDYARAMADGGMLAIIACLGLAQLGHETTSALTQLGFGALLYFSLAALHYHPRLALACAWLGTVALGLSGAPTLATLLLLGGTLVHALDRNADAEPDAQDPHGGRTQALLWCALPLSAWLFWRLDLWRWKLEFPQARWADWSGLLQLLTWFTWPAWPLALWTLWRWRRQLFSRIISRHLALPAWFVVMTLAATLTSGAPDRTLMLGLPALASLAAFALPTLKRPVASLIDWFTLLFFSGCGFTIWVVWIAMQTGFPPQPAANVQRLAPGFVPSFSLLACACAIAATLVWAWLVRWRVGRHRAAIWKSLVLPAGGAALCWLLLMSLWLPLLNYTQSYTSMVRRTQQQLVPAGCVETLGLSQAKVAALQVYGRLALQPMQSHAHCPWLLAEPGVDEATQQRVDNTQWDLQTQLRHPADGSDTLLIFKRR